MKHSIPAHVPADLVVDLDIYTVPVVGGRDAQQAWRSFSGKGPLVFSPYNGGHWIATNAATIFKFYNDVEHFSSRKILPNQPDDMMLIPIQMDPPVHSAYRSGIQPLFTPGAVDVMTKNIRGITIDLIEDFRARGECEFITEFAMQFPLVIFLQLMGLPLEDRLYLRGLVEIYASDPDPAAKSAVEQKMFDYIDRHIAERSGGQGADAISMVTRLTANGKPYTRDEMISTCTLLLHAGLDTVFNTLGFFARHLALYPEDRAYIRHNTHKMADIVQELLRRYSVTNQSRYVAKDVTYDGVTLKAGDMVTLPGSLFNLDPEMSENPDKVDFERKGRNVTFGSGPHTCVGALLARREFAVFLEEWLVRIPDFEIDPNRPPEMRTGLTNTIEALWLRWDPAQALAA